MAVSPTTVVLGVLTCIPFGLAARDTLNGESTPRIVRDEHADYGTEEYERAAEERRQERARRDEEAAAAEAVRNEKLDAIFGQVLGGDAATLSPQFALKLGDRPAKPGASLFPDQAAFEDEHELTLGTDLLDGAVNGITMEPRVGSANASAMCDRMATWLDERWGGAVEDSKRSIWLSDTAQQRAVLLQIGDNCKLVVERTTSLEDWIAKTPESIVPVWALGKSPKQLAAALGIDIAAGDTFEWKAPGLGASTGKTELVGYVRRGKIVAIAAHTNHSFDGSEIREYLITTFGEPTEDDRDVWKNPPLALMNDRGRVSIIVGTIPL